MGERENGGGDRYAERSATIATIKKQRLIFEEAQSDQRVPRELLRHLVEKRRQGNGGRRRERLFEKFEKRSWERAREKAREREQRNRVVIGCAASRATASKASAPPSATYSSSSSAAHAGSVVAAQN